MRVHAFTCDEECREVDSDPSRRREKHLCHNENRGPTDAAAQSCTAPWNPSCCTPQQMLQLKERQQTRQQLCNSVCDSANAPSGTARCSSSRFCIARKANALRPCRTERTQFSQTIQMWMSLHSVTAATKMSEPTESQKNRRKDLALDFASMKSTETFITQLVQYTAQL
mgnify:CR=1 FL=1